MDVIEIEKKLEGLVRLFFEDSPKEILTSERLPRQRLTASIQNYLENLRVCIIYLKFDLETTRRENEFLRNLVKELNQ